VRVLQVCTNLLTARTFIAPVARYLAARGYDVAVACSPERVPEDPLLSVEGVDAGCPLYPVPIPRAIHPLQDLRAIWEVYRLIRRLQPDIVHAQNSKAGVVARLAARLAGTPVIIYSAHGFPFHPSLSSFRHRAYVMIERWVCRFTDLILVETEFIRSYGMHHRVVRDPAKLVVVPMGVDLKKFSPSPHGPDNLRETLGFGAQDLVVGTVARLVPDKGLECFMRMAARIQAVRSDVRFLLVGDGPLREALARLAETLGIRPQVVFAGYRADVPALMEAMDLFVLPTLREGFGVVFAEAMAMGKATIGSRIGPVGEVVEDGVTGFLVPPEEPETFAARALELLGDERKRRAFGEAGRRRVEKLYDEARMCETIEQHFRRLLMEKGVT
jgi:glycosyltransferase involved in cell wall biosynthesis